MKLMFAILIPILLIVGFVYALYLERRDYNKGYCPNCGHKLKWFDIDSHGSRGYKCNHCNYVTWVSWGFIDSK